MKHGFIGFGKLGIALYKSICKEEGNTFCYFSKSNSNREVPGCDSIGELASKSEVIWLCVKPQNLVDILDILKYEDLTGKIVVSPVAGKSIGFILESVGKNTPVIRIMPNLAIEYGSSVTAYASNDIDSNLKNRVRLMLEKSGRLIDLPEIHFDLFTAIFGSGPAFLLKLLDIQKLKIMELGINENEANNLLVGLLAGTTDYYRENCNFSSIDELINNIASKGGTTEAGLNYLIDNNIGKLFDNVINMAQKRSLEIGVTKNF